MKPVNSAAKEKLEIVNVRGRVTRISARHPRRRRRRNAFELFQEYTTKQLWGSSPTRKIARFRRLIFLNWRWRESNARAKGCRRIFYQGLVCFWCLSQLVLKQTKCKLTDFLNFGMPARNCKHPSPTISCFIRSRGQTSSETSRRPVLSGVSEREILHTEVWRKYARNCFFGS